MRIISDFYDYYDSVAKVMYDGSVIYNRQTKIIEGPKCYSYDRGLTKSVTVNFCGYSFLGVSFQMKDTSYSRYMWDATTITKFVAEHFPKELVKRERFIYGNPYRENFEKRYENFYKNRPQPSTETWEKYGVPIIAVQNKNTILNPNLDDFDFQRVKDPYTAFQELYMYLGSKAAPEKPIPQPTDKVMAEIKGFDKFSFRKDKATK